LVWQQCRVHLSSLRIAVERTENQITMARKTNFKYRPPSPFHVLLRIAKGEIGNIDSFREHAEQAHQRQKVYLERVASKRSGELPDDADWLVDDFRALEDFASLSAEFSIVGLWRCIELFRKRAIWNCLGKEAAAGVFRHKKFQSELSKLRIKEKRISCSATVDELRCLNNSIKHDQRVGSELAAFRYWKNREGRPLGNLAVRYPRFRTAAERYLNDLTGKLVSRVRDGGMSASAQCRARLRAPRRRTS
jgi:hypothetical protein